MSAESSPPRPEAPHFDPAQGAWVLSRYRDVLAAFREPRLWPIWAGAMKPRTRGCARKHWRRFLRRHWPAGKRRSNPWRAASSSSFPTDCAVDLVGEFAQLWSLAVAVLVTGTGAADGERLAALARQVSAAAAEPDDSALQSRAAAATAELEGHFQKTATPLGEPAFVALSQTLPCGLVRQLFRQAAADVDLGGVRIAEGERVILMLAAANRDPAQFPGPDRLDVTRQAAGQVALGAGPHACIGASLIRRLRPARPAHWSGGWFRRPRAIPFMVRRIRVSFAGGSVCSTFSLTGIP